MAGLAYPYKFQIFGFRPNTEKRANPRQNPGHKILNFGKGPEPNPNPTQWESGELIGGGVIVLHTLIVLGLGWVPGLCQNLEFRGRDFAEIYRIS